MSQAGSGPGKAEADPGQYRAALESWLRAKRSDAPDLRVTSVDIPQSTGFSNETVFFDVEGLPDAPTTRFVARIEQASGPLFPAQTSACTSSVQVQHDVMAVVARRGVAPVPPVVAEESDPAILGRPFFVMEFVGGDIPGDVPIYSESGFLVEDASPDQRQRLVLDGIDKMVALQEIDWRADGLDWLDSSGRGEPTFAAQLALYRRYVEEALDGREHPVLTRTLDWLEADVPTAPVQLSWGDSRIGNMIWRDYRCVGVIDWEAASLAPAEADLGWWIMYDRMSFDDKSIARLEGFPTREQMIDHWEARSGRGVAGSIDYWEVFGVMRFCAIMVRLGDRLVARGLVPEEANMSVENGTTQSLARLHTRLGI